MQQENKIYTLPKCIEESIKIIIKKEGYKDYNINWRISTEGGGYIGIIYYINITEATSNASKETNIFIKHKSDKNQLKIYSLSECFIRECFIYKEISNIFMELQNEAKISKHEWFTVAKCFDECSSSDIILENLNKRGFNTYPNMNIVSLEYAELAIEHLARFHGLTFVLQKKRTHYFYEKIKTMKQPFIFGDDWRGFVKNISDYSLKCLENNVRESKKDLIMKKVDEYETYLNDIPDVCTMCHGDFKHNNIMFKEINGKLNEVLAIDYQLLHYGNPVLDFIYFIFNGTDQEFRQNHLTHLKSLYYSTMKRFLQYFEIGIESVFPRELFEKEYRQKLDYGLMINVFYVPYLFIKKDNAPDLNNQSLDKIDYIIDERFTERFRGVVDDFIQWGYL